MLKLPDVTLVITETRAHELGRLAVEACLANAQFADVVIYTDRPELIDVPMATYFPIPDWPNKVAAGRFYYMEAAHRVDTSHALLIEWDGGINEPAIWRDAFLQYDYIGAPWPLFPLGDGAAGNNVGNGGFTLLSKRLADYVYQQRARLNIATDVDISIKRRSLIPPSFVWAPETVAADFAFEGWTRAGPTRLTGRPHSFGFHGSFNWPHILDREDLVARSRLVAQNDFLINTGKWRWLAAPGLRNQIGAEIYDAACRRRPPRPMARGNW